MRLPSIFLFALSALTAVAFSADDAAPGCTSCGMAMTVRRKTNANQTIQVSEVENSFLLPNITIQAGDIVTWTNNGMIAHTTTSDDGLWDSGSMDPGKTFSHTFKSPGTYPYSCVFHKFKGMKGKVTVLPPAPVISSSLTVVGAAGLPFRYDITGTNSPDTFTADSLPPGLLLNGSVISGVSPNAGSFQSTIGVSSASGTDSKSLAIQFIPAIPQLDSDDDGFSDTLETLAGSSPIDSSSVPLNAIAPGLAPISVSKFSCALNFAKSGHDSLKITGTVNTSSLAPFVSNTVAIDCGGVVRLFLLDGNASAKSGSDSLAFALLKRSAGSGVGFKISLSKGTFAQTLSQIGFDASVDAKSVQKAMSLTLVAGGTHFQHTQIVSYTSKTNKSGIGK